MTTRRDACMEALSESPIFGALSAQELAQLADLGREERVPAGKTIFHKGDEAAAFYVVVDGLARASTTSKDGRELILGEERPGDVFGEIALFDRKPRTATIATVSPMTMVAFSFRDIRAYLLRHPEVALRILEFLAARLRSTIEQLEDNVFLRVDQRLAKTLLRIAEEQGQETPDGLRVVLTLTQRELAEMVGSVRERVNKQLSRWEEDGVIQREKDAIRIDVEKLRLVSSSRGRELA
ncbi:MAG: Crp/Fnr family transcriptional regulator [Myxococcota bacterium]|nr:Crp/Fnr family transcriptional regulator [Myxococcota bacterium]